MKWILIKFLYAGDGDNQTFTKKIQLLFVFLIYPIYSGTCQLPDVVYKGVYIVDNEVQEAGATVLFGSKVTLACNEGYKFSDSTTFEMNCESPASTFYNKCFSTLTQLEFR